MSIFFAFLGWIAFVVSALLAVEEKDSHKKAIEQKNNALKVWQRECVHWRELSADKDSEIARMTMEIERLTPKHGSGGRFVSKTAL